MLTMHHNNMSVRIWNAKLKLWIHERNNFRVSCQNQFWKYSYRSQPVVDSNRNILKMLKVEANQTLCRIIKMFHLIGIWRKDEEKSASYTTDVVVRKLLYVLYYILFQIFLVTCALLSDSSTEKIFLTSIEIILSVVTIKLGHLLWNKDKIQAFLFDPIVAHSTDSDADNAAFELVDKGIKKIMKFVHWYLLMMGITFVFYILSVMPMLSSNEDERKLPFFISFTLVGKYSEFIYWIAYAFVISEIFFGFTCSLINVIIWYILFNYSLEYQLLGNEFRSLGRNKMMTGMNVFYRDLVHAVRRQRNIFLYWTMIDDSMNLTTEIFFSFQTFHRTIDRFKSFFSKLFLAQIATSGVTICVSAYVLAYVSITLHSKYCLF